MTATELTADDLEATHPYLPTDWRRTMGMILAAGGPWACSRCGGPSYLCYRCSKCFYDLA